MTWGNGTPTILCEECGHEAMPEFFIWYQGEVAICKDIDMCKQRQEVNQVVVADQLETPYTITEESIPTCPECRDGKHMNCIGSAIHPVTDDIVDCLCDECHKLK